MPDESPSVVRVEEGALDIEGARRPYSLFLPPGGCRGRPALLFLHGFSRGKSKHRGLARRLASRGLVVLTPDLAPLLRPALLGAAESGRERCVREAVAFARWLAADVTDGKIALAGFSAGGAVAFEAAVELQSSGLPPVAVLLLDAVPWSRTVAAAPRFAAPPCGVLLMETEASSFNLYRGFRKEVLPQLPEWRRQGVLLVSVPGSRHIDAEAAGRVCDDRLAWEEEDGSASGARDWFVGRLIWGEAQPEFAVSFQTLAEAFLTQSLLAEHHHEEAASSQAASASSPAPAPAPPQVHGHVMEAVRRLAEERRLDVSDADFVRQGILREGESRRTSAVS